MRLKLIVMNILYIVAAGFAAASLFLSPLINLNLGYTLTAEVMQSVVGNGLGDDVDFEEIVKDEQGHNIVLELGVKVDTMVAIKGAFEQDPYAYAKTSIIDANIDHIVETLKPNLERVVRQAAQQSARSRAKDTIRDEINHLYPAQNADEVMSNAGITDEFLDEKIESFIEELEKPGATIDSVVDALVDAINDVYAQLATSYPLFIGNQVTSAEENELKNEVRNALQGIGIADSEGNILGIDSAIASIFENLMGGSGGEHGDEEVPPPLDLLRIDEEDESADELADKLKEILYAKIDESGGSIGLGFKIAGFVIIFMAGAWALMALFALLKSFFKNPAIFFGLVYWVNFLLLLIIGIILPFATPLLLQFGPAIPLIGPMIAQYTGNIALAFISSATIPAFVSVGVLITSFLYKHWAKKWKDEM